MSDDIHNQGVESVIRSLVSAAEFREYKRTGKYNLGDGVLNRMIHDFVAFGYLNELQHKKLKKRLTSCELNVHLDELPGAKRRGSLVVLPGGLAEDEWPVVKYP